MNKAVFLDRDGTINVDKGYLYRIEDFVFLPGAVEGLKLLQEAGFLLVIVTNQSGIARGFFSEDDFNKLNTFMLEELNQRGVHIAGVYYCPHLPDAKIEQYRMSCECRKPGLALFMQAVEYFRIDLSRSFAVGDRLRDCSICEKYMCRGFLIHSNVDEALIEQVKAGKITRVRYAEDLAEAARYIIMEELR